jgi:hypothetical protein
MQDEKRTYDENLVEDAFLALMNARDRELSLPLNAWAERNLLKRRIAFLVGYLADEIVTREVAAQKERDADGMVMVPIEPTEAMLEAVVPFPEHLFADGKRGADYRKDMEIAVMVDRAAFVSQYRKAIAAAIRSAG